MSDKLLCQFISRERMSEIDHWIAKYPSDQKASAVMSTLRIVQEEHGWLSPQLLDAVADYLDMPSIAVYEVASFYSMYHLQPTGRNCINVCTNISCMLAGSADIVKHLEKKLDIKLGETTEDGRFTLCSVECLGACVNAPMMQINKNYHENLKPDQTLDTIVDEYQ
jgi:NADH-quinone oxidoreductase subunit E